MPLQAIECAFAPTSTTSMSAKLGTFPHWDKVREFVSPRHLQLLTLAQHVVQIYSCSLSSYDPITLLKSH